MRKCLGVVAAMATHALFAWTVCRLFLFLDGSQPHSESAHGSLTQNLLLGVAFGALHSFLLHPRIRQGLSRWIPPAFYGLFFCVVTCVSLCLTFAGWSHSRAVWWELTGPARWGVQALWFASWGLLVYSLWLSGLGYQTGATPWWSWMRDRPLPTRPFRPRGPFLWLRHPAYLGFLGLVWWTPVMTADRLVLIGVWTVYILNGSWLKDLRLVYFLGTPYQIYQSQVAGFPGVWWGPLAKRPLSALALDPETVAAAPVEQSRRFGALAASLPAAVDSADRELVAVAGQDD
ncbi:MAG: hypothetical protein JSS02_21115 [Planctomycetes bacterium]|nr:hypothetical protein [Planctomycetota bacterium]